MNRNQIGCLSNSAIFSSLITLILILIFIFFSGGKYFSPGGLNAKVGKNIGGVNSHALIGNKCAACHSAPWDSKPMDELCKACHTDITAQLTKPSSAHSIMIGKTNLMCRDCHTEHRGENASLIDTGRAVFPHNTARFSLKAHKNNIDKSLFTCKDCHLNDVMKFEVETCSNCHKKIDDLFIQKHIVIYGTNCLGCHDGLETFNRKYDHNKLSFKVEGKHIGLSCENCHKDIQKKADFSKLSSQCISCHKNNDPHSGKFGQECDSCHSVTGWKPATFDHNLSNFKLTGAHASTACEKCHINNVFKGTNTECSGCHKEPAFHAGLFSGAACSNCHNTIRWSPAKFSLPHPEPSTGGEGGSGINHGGAACRDCHTVNLLSATCTACHDSNNPSGN